MHSHASNSPRTHCCYLELFLILNILSLSFGCPNTECDGRGADLISKYSGPSSNACLNDCVNNAECKAYGYGGKHETDYCRLFRGYQYDDQISGRLHSCVSILWSSWENGHCSVTCGNGQRQAVRYCCGTSCSQTSETVTENCETGVNCPIDGNWSPWGSYTTCSVTCGGGSQTRSRSCTNPAPQNGGSSCSGDSTQYSSCNSQNCPIDGGWSTWTNWGECDATCAGGYQIRSRTCSNPNPDHGGALCRGDDEEISDCNTHECPVDGGWSPWASWGPCVVNGTCGGGYRSRNRTCSNPYPQHGGENCAGAEKEEESCFTNFCPVDGEWSTWGSWEECSVTCGEGIRYRNRSCTDPVPSFGGNDCAGNQTMSDICNTGNCPVDGGWSHWESWAPCVANGTCGGGFRSRNRTCSSPYPQHGGENCVGDELEEESCFAGFCPVDGGWSTWGSWEECSVTCGEGIRYRNRSCTDPVPFFGGVDCVGNHTVSDTCNMGNCPVNGGWSTWGSWEECSVTCGEGIRYRNRSCTDPVPFFGGVDCVGNHTVSDTCNMGNCPDSDVLKAECKCTCVEEDITLEEKIMKMTKELKVNTSELSSSKRKLTSAEDRRTSATQVGLIGVTLLTLCGFFIISGDLFSVFSYVCFKLK